MEKNLEKSLKRYLKRKVKITLGLVVSFLITGMVSFAEKTITETVEINLENGNIQITPNAGKIEENTWTFDDIIDVQNGNGIKITGENKDFNIINDGYISGNGSGEKSGNGIYNDSGTIGKLENNGTILGKVNVVTGKSGNGIYNDRGKIESLTNNGNIIGNEIGICNNYTTITTLTNNGNIFGDNFGISYNNGTIESLTNTGIISGKGSGENSESSILNLGGTIGSLTNTGIISGKGSGENSGNGIFNLAGTIESLTNTGIISGKGNGISNGLNGKIGNLTNTGIISGKGSGNYLGNGILNINGTIGSLINAGIISGRNKAIEGVDESNITNLGLLINGAGTDNPKITAGKGGEASGKYIINGVKFYGDNNEAKAINSYELSKKDNLIINVVGETDTAFNIDRVFSTSNSIINGYKNAVVLKNGGDFTGDNITVNAGENAFIGSNLVDSINLSNGSAVDGNIDLGEGEDKITFNSSTLNGDIKGDNDIITIVKSEINGDITSSNGKVIISGGENTLFNTGSSVVNGNITLTDGEISIADGTQINGKIELGGDTATVWLNQDQLLNDKLNITATEKILGLNYNINNFNDMESMKTHINSMKDYNTIKFADGENSSIYLTEVTGNKTFIGGNGDDTFIVSLDNLKNDISINGGKDNKENPYNDKDMLKLTTEVNIQDENTNLFDNVKNIETLQLANGENTINVGNLKFTSILGGFGKNTFKVSVDKLQNISIDGRANGTDKGDILELTTVVDNTGNTNLFDKVENIETLKLADVDGNKLDINNISTSNPDTLRFKNYIGGAKDDSFTVSIENFDKLSLIDGGANGTVGDTLKINGEKDETEIFLNKTTGIENFIMTSSKYSTNNNIIHINDWDYLNSNKDKISIILTQQAIDNYIKGSKESIESLKNITGYGNGYSTRVILTDNISDKNVSDKGATNEDYNFISKLNKVTDLYLANGDNYVDVNKIMEINLNINKNPDVPDENLYGKIINYIALDNISKDNKDNSGTNYFKISSDNLNKIQISLDGSTSTEDTLEITDTFTNDRMFMSPTGIEKLVLSGKGNVISINRELVGDAVYSGFNEIIGKDGGKDGNTFTINEMYPNDKVLGIKIEGGKSSNDTLKIDTENIKELTPTYNTLEKVLINKTGIENLVLGNADNTIDFTYKDQDKNLEGFKNIISGKGSDHFKVSADNIGSMTIDGGGTVVSGGGGLVSRDHDILKLSGVIDNDAKGKENILNGISNVEDLELDNGENILNIDNIKRVDPNNTLGFKNIYGGNGNDTFKVSVENLAKLGILKGEISQGINDNDRLEITSGDIKDNSLEKVKNIESLTFAKNSSNVIGLDNLSFNSITKEGTGKDTFTINSNTDKLKMEINGGDGQYDTLKVNTSINMTNKGELQNIKGIENLLVNSKNGVNNLRFNKFNINSFEHIGLDGAENNLSLINLDKNILVLFRNENTDKNNLSVNDDNNIFNHTVIGANNINLYAKDKNTEWTFGKDATIMNNNKNTNINTDGIFNLGNIVSGKDGFTINEDFASTGSDITLNGDIKLTISKDTTFALEKLYNFSFSKLSLGADSEIILPEFLKTQNINQKDFTFRVKNWEEYTSVAQNRDFMTYEGRYKEAISKYNKDTAITNAFNSFTEDTIFNYVTNNMGDKLVYYSDEDTKPYAVKITGEDIVIKTNPDKSKDQSLNLAFNNISSSGNISIKATGGNYNTVTFGNGEGTSVIISSGDKDKLSVINGTSSTEDLTLNFNGATNKVDKIVIDNGKKNSIKIKGDTEVKEILLGSGNDSIYAGEDSQKLTIGNINLGSGDDMINIGSTGEIKLSNINLGSGKNEIYFRDISKVKEFNITKSDADAQNNVIITETGNNNESFNTILAGSKKNVDNITVYGENTLNISKDFDGELTFAESRDNVIGIETDYTGSISFTRGENTVNLSSGTVDGNKLSLAENGNNLNITGGTLLNGITFDTNSYGNKVTVSENGSIGKNIIFGTGTGDEFNLISKTGDFDYNIENADTINLNGKNNQWKFSQSSTIKGDNVIVNLNDSGEIGFNIGKSDTGLVLGKDGVNPFATTGKYTINGDIKLTFDDTFTFSSLNDKLSVNTNILAGSTSKVYIPEFIKYDNKTFSIKSAEKLKAFGLGDYAFGNYEHAILNYNKAGYEGITSMLNNNSLTDISKVLNKGIDEKDHYFYSDSREIKDVTTLGNINIQTSKDNQVTGDKLNTDIKFTNVTGNVANINFAQGTVNKVSFLDGVNISKIDGSQSEAGFDLTLGKVNFTTKDETKVTMSNYDDTLNINSSINDISVNAGAGNDTVNILSSIKGIFDGNSGDNTLNIGAKTQTLSNEKPKDEIVLSGEVKNFKDINLNQNTKLDSKLAITGTNNINIGKDKVLSLGIDFDKKDSNGKVIGHSLYNKGITVNNNDGNIMVDVAETSKDTLISLGEKDSASKLTNDKNLLISGSTNHDIAYDKDNDDIKVNVKEHFIGKEEEVKYGHLDKIYQSIYSADKVGLMAPSSTLKDKTKDEAIKAQLEFYGKIYHSTPYAYTHKISKKSAELITDSLMLNDGMPEVNSWRFGGSIAGRELENSENFYGNNYYNGIDVGNTEVKAETNIYGAYAFGEYGFEEGKAVGFAVAGSKSDTDIGSSSLKGNNVFVSAYVKQDINNVNMIAGIGYQRGFYDATRNVSNAYQSMQVEKDFEDNTFVGYFGAKYRYDFGNNFYLEPNGELRLTHSVQDDIKEDNRGDLSIEVDNKDFTSVDGELGVNLGKRIATENGVLNLKAGVSVNYALLGNDEEYLNARITGSTKDFTMISPEDEDRAKVNVLLKAEYQANNGMYYDVHYKTTTDNDDYSVGFGVGYKF